jgi:hypothetical protein
VTPGGAGTGNPAILHTVPDGRAVFEWELNESESATLSIHEGGKRGFTINQALSSCTVHGANATVIRTALRTTQPIAENLVVPPGGFVTCLVYNQRNAGNLEVVKELDPGTDPGRFNLLVDGFPWRSDAGHLDKTNPILVATGPHIVSETAFGDTNLDHYSVSTTCVSQNEQPVRTRPAPGSGPGAVKVIVTKGANITCTIRNTNTQFGNLTVIKNLDPPGSGTFDLFIGAERVAQGAGNGDRGTATNLPFGKYQVVERAVPPTNPDDFITSVTCEDPENGNPVDVISGDGTESAPAVVMLDRASVQCTITNVKPSLFEVAHLEVVKRLRPAGDPGRFDLLIDGKAFAIAAGSGGTTEPVALVPGLTYKVSEDITGADAHALSLADYSISTRCVNHGTPFATSGTGSKSDRVSVHLRAGDNVVCTITNERKSPETDGGGGAVPPPECVDIDNGIPECAELAAAPQLVVRKQMTAHARVGDRVRITMIVHNFGHGTAEQVRLHETPPHGGRIVGVADHGLIQRDGTTVWNLGNLAPGETRTVHATMLITRTGLHLNTAVASARNSRPSVAQATVRARAPVNRPRPPAPRPPIVTG